MDRKRLADEPDGTVEPAGAPSTNMLVIRMPLTVICAPEDAEWNSSVGAPFPASHPAMAGISRARAPAPSSRRPAAVFPELARIKADASSFKGTGGGSTPVTATWPGNPLQAVEMLSVQGITDAAGRGFLLSRSGSGGTGRARAGARLPELAHRGRVLEFRRQVPQHLGGSVLEDKQDREAGRPVPAGEHVAGVCHGDRRAATVAGGQPGQLGQRRAARREVE